MVSSGSHSGIVSYSFYSETREKKQIKFADPVTFSETRLEYGRHWVCFRGVFVRCMLHAEHLKQRQYSYACILKHTLFLFISWFYHSL